jgi:Right handed beta helix region
MTTAWLQGTVLFGSNSTFTDLKIGPNVAGHPSISNAAGSNGTTFLRCHFRGGGGAAYWGPNLLLGVSNNLSNLTFTDCDIEACLGSGNYNTISQYAWNNYIDTVTYTRCRFGVSNGVRDGSTRAINEMYTDNSAGSWWKDVSYLDCEFYVANWHVLDFTGSANSPNVTGAIVDGCLFHGSNDVAIALEWPFDVHITNNTFYRCRGGGIVWGAMFCTDVSPGVTVTGNTFDWDTVEKGLTVGNQVIHWDVSDGTFSGNTIICHTNPTYAIFWAQSATNSAPYISTVVSNNTLTLNKFYVSSNAVVYRQDGNASNTFLQSATNPPTGTYNAVVRR